MSLNKVRALGDDRAWKDEVERELKSLLDIIKYGKITIRAASTSSGGGGGSSSPGADLITATLPATYDSTNYIVGVDQDAFDRIGLLDYAEFDTSYSGGSTDVGILAWSQEFETLEAKLDSNVTLQFGQEHLVRVKNASGSTAIPIMSVVMFAGATGDTVTVSPAVTDGSVSEDYIVGVTTEEIPADGFGFVTQFGFITGVDTSAYTLGNILYANPATAGSLTATAPSAPNLKLPIAAVTRVHASTGRVLVRAFVGKKLFELHDVQIASITDGELLSWSNTNSRWENKTPAEASLLTTSATLDSLADVVITTPATDQVVKYDGTNWVNAASPGGGGGTVTSITAGTGLSASPSSPITTSGTLNVTDVAINPVGSVTMFAGSGTPSGWLLCDGAAVSRTTYATLFAAIGTAYGVGDGSTTFNLPSMTARFPRGATTAGTGAGSDTHSHPLSNSGYAKVRRAVNRIVLEQTTAASWTATQEVSGTGDSSTTSGTAAAGLGGNTDSANNIPAYTNFRFIIKT